MREESSVQNNSTEVVAVAKKHKIVYVSLIIVLLIGLLITLSSYKYIGVILIILAINKIIFYATIQWILTDEVLIIKEGYLPWKKVHFEIPLQDVYESYYTQSMMAKMFGYAEIVIRRTDGVSTQFNEKTFTNYKILTQELNQRIRLYKSQKQNFTQNTQINVYANEDFMKLVKLHEKGLISDQEFIDLKKNALGSN